MKFDNELEQKVFNVFSYCNWSQYEKTAPPEKPVVVDGIIHRMKMLPSRIEEQKNKIQEILDEMPPEFHKSKGGGWSFLNLCNDRHGNQWTGMHALMEYVVILALASGMGKFLMPRECWKSFPGEMPYIVFDTSV